MELKNLMEKKELGTKKLNKYKKEPKGSFLYLFFSLICFIKILKKSIDI